MSRSSRTALWLLLVAVLAVACVELGRSSCRWQTAHAAVGGLRSVLEVEDRGRRDIPPNGHKALSTTDLREAAEDDRAVRQAEDEAGEEEEGEAQRTDHNDRARLRRVAAAVDMQQLAAELPRPYRATLSRAGRPRVMLVLYPRKWPTAFYIHALGRAGFELSAVTADNETNSRIVAASAMVQCYFLCGQSLNASCLAKAIAYCGPDRLVALSDVATASIITLAEALRLGADTVVEGAGKVPLPPLPALDPALEAAFSWHRAIVARSLPWPAHWYALLDKSTLVYDVAHLSLGLRVPDRFYLDQALVDAVVRDKPTELTVNGTVWTFPMVMKTTRGVAGQGVKVLVRASDLGRGFGDFSKRLNGSLVRNRVSHKMDGVIDGDVRIFIERYYSGKAAMLNVVAVEGKILAAFNLWKNITDSATGPSQVNSLLHHEGMLAAAKTIVEYLGYNGFLGLEFMVNNLTNEALLIDVNPRINPGSIHEVDRFGWVPLSLPRALAIAMKDDTDPRLGIATPSAKMMAALHKGPLFVKFEYRTMHAMLKRLLTSPTMQMRRAHFTHAPWCDPPVQQIMLREFNVTMNSTDCRVSVPPPPGSKNNTAANRKYNKVLYFIDSPCSCG